MAIIKGVVQPHDVFHYFNWYPTWEYDDATDVLTIRYTMPEDVNGLSPVDSSGVRILIVAGQGYSHTIDSKPLADYPKGSLVEHVITDATNRWTTMGTIRKTTVGLWWGGHLTLGNSGLSNTSVPLVDPHLPGRKILGIRTDRAIPDGSSVPAVTGGVLHERMFDGRFNTDPLITSDTYSNGVATNGSVMTAGNTLGTRGGMWEADADGDYEVTWKIKKSSSAGSATFRFMISADAGLSHAAWLNVVVGGSSTPTVYRPMVRKVGEHATRTTIGDFYGGAELTRTSGSGGVPRIYNGSGMHTIRVRAEGDMFTAWADDVELFSWPREFVPKGNYFGHVSSSAFMLLHELEVNSLEPTVPPERFHGGEITIGVHVDGKVTPAAPVIPGVAGRFPVTQHGAKHGWFPEWVWDEAADRVTVTYRMPEDADGHAAVFSAGTRIRARRIADGVWVDLEQRPLALWPKGSNVIQVVENVSAYRDMFLLPAPGSGLLFRWDGHFLGTLLEPVVPVPADLSVDGGLVELLGHGWAGEPGQIVDAGPDGDLPAAVRFPSSARSLAVQRDNSLWAGGLYPLGRDNDYDIGFGVRHATYYLGGETDHVVGADAEFTRALITRVKTTSSGVTTLTILERDTTPGSPARPGSLADGGVQVHLTNQLVEPWLVAARDGAVLRARVTGGTVTIWWGEHEIWSGEWLPAGSHAGWFAKGSYSAPDLFTVGRLASLTTAVYSPTTMHGAAPVLIGVEAEGQRSGTGNGATHGGALTVSVSATGVRSGSYTAPTLIHGAALVLVGVGSAGVRTGDYTAPYAVHGGTLIVPVTVEVDDLEVDSPALQPPGNTIYDENDQPINLTGGTRRPPVPPTVYQARVRALSAACPTMGRSYALTPFGWPDPDDFVADWLFRRYGWIRVLVDGVDVTWFRDRMVQVENYSLTDPFGPATASLWFPQVTRFEGAFPDWLRMGKTVRFVLIGEHGHKVRDLWEGFITEIVPVSEGRAGGRIGVRVECSGTLYQADLQHSKVSYIARVEPVEKKISRELNRVEGRRYKKFAPNKFRSWVATRANGNLGDPILTGTVQDMLAQAVIWSTDGTWSDQMTVRWQGRRRFGFAFKHENKKVWRAHYGAPGLTVDLVRNLREEPTAIYGRGTSEAGSAWANVQFPYLNTGGFDQPYPYGSPGTVMTTGSTDGGTTTGKGVSHAQAELRRKGYKTVTVDGVYGAVTAAAVANFQDDSGVQVDGVVGPQTWVELFAVSGGSGLNLVRTAPLASRNERYRYTKDGARKGERDAFDPGRLRVERFNDYPDGTSKPVAAGSAEAELERDGKATWMGTITFDKIGPENGHPLDIQPGDFIDLLGWDRRLTPGEGLELYVADVDVSDPGPGGKVVLTVDSNARDYLTLAEALEISRENRSPSRRPGSGRGKSSRAPVDADLVGVIEAWPVLGGLWSRVRVPLGQSGHIVRLNFTTDPKTKFAVAFSTGEMTPNELAERVGNPLEPRVDNYQPFPGDELTDEWLESKGFMGAWGGPGQAAGYYPGAESDETPVTGRLFADGLSWSFDTNGWNVPWVWVYAFSPTTTELSGRVRVGPQDL